MRNFSRLIEIASALKPNLQCGKNFHVTFCLKNGKIIEIGHNNYLKRNRVADSYRASYNDANYVAGIHSENMVLGKIKYRDDIKDLTLVNIRILNNGELANSCPCSNCAYYIGRFGIRKVFFSTSGGFQKFKNF